MARALGRLEHRFDRRLRRRQVRGKAALVADRGGETALVEQAAERVERLGPDPHRLGKRAGAGRDDHELLEVDRVLRMGSAVDHVHHRHGQDTRVLAAQPAVERLLRIRSSGPGRRERDAQNRVRSEAALVRRPVELDEAPVEGRLVGRVHSADRPRDLARDVRDRARDALSAVGGTAVA